MSQLKEKSMFTVLVITINQNSLKKTVCLSFLTNRRFESVEPIGTLVIFKFKIEENKIKIEINLFYIF